MNTQLRVLIVEDSESDARLIARRLQKAGYDLQYKRVETAAAMQTALAQQEWDLVIADYNLPGFSGPAALEIFKARALDMPFIVVSAIIGEDKAVAMMKAGANDYIMKDSLARLAPAVERELREAEGRRQRRQAEAALWEAHRAWEEIFQAISHPTIIMDAEHNIMAANRATLSAVRLTAAEILNRKCYEIFHHTAQSPPGCPMQRLLASGQVETAEMEIELLEGVYLVSCTPVFDAQGNLQKVIHLATDITERKRAEAALLKYEFISNTSSDYMTLINPNYIYEAANAAFCQAHGKTREEVVGTSLANIWGEDRFKNIIKGYLDRCFTGQEVKSEHWFEFGKRGRGCFNISYRPYFNEDGMVAYASVVSHDITERKQAEAALRESEEKFRNLFNNSGVAMFRTRLDGSETLDINEKFLEIAGRTRAETQGTPSVIFWEEPTERDEMARRLVANGRVSEFEFRMRNKRGGVRDCLTSLVLYREQGILEGTIIDITERRQAEEALRKAEEKYRNIFEQAVEGIFQSSPAGRYLSANPALVGMLGYESPEELMAEIADIKTQIYVDPKRRAEFQRLMARDGLVKGFEHQCYRKDGKVLWFSLNARTVRDAQGDILYYEGFVQDISERKKAETELAGLRRHQELILNAIWEGILGIDLDGHITFVNPAAARFLGYEMAEILGCGSHSTWHHSRADGRPYPAEECPIRAAIKKGEAHCGLEQFFWRKDGTGFPVEYSLAPITEGGEVTGGVVTFWDISQRQEDRALTRSLIAASPVGLYLLQKGKFVLTNPWFHNITGYNENETLNLNFWNLVHPEDREAVRTNALKMLRGERFVPYEYRHIAKGGGIKWIMETVTPIQYQGKRATLGYFMDITEHKQLEEEFLHAQKMEAVGRLAGGVAHDFNNMLGAIMGYAHLIRLTLSEGDECLDHIQGIKEAAQRAVSLTRQLLAFSRKQVTKPEIINVNEVVSGLKTMMRPIIGEDIDLSMELGPSLAAVKADPGQIAQIIMNLAVNARDAMPAGGKLTIETADVFLSEPHAAKHPGVLPGPYVRLTVSDTGAGIDEETLPHIFEPFFTTKTVGKGTGLGLSTVFGIVQQNGGFIEVASECGLGTVFKIYFPQVQDEFEPLAETSVITTLKGSETIMLVEDEDMLRKLIKTYLERHGYKVMSSRDGGEALLLVINYKERIDLLLTDVVMPVMSGRELAERLAPMRPEMQVLYISGYTEDAPGLKGLIDEATPFLQKPFRLVDLVSVVRRILDLKARVTKN